MASSDTGLLQRKRAGRGMQPRSGTHGSGGPDDRGCGLATGCGWTDRRRISVAGAVSCAQGRGFLVGTLGVGALGVGRATVVVAAAATPATLTVDIAVTAVEAIGLAGRAVALESLP